jgi:hypothetical protein
MEWRVVSRDGRRARVAHRVTVVARVACRVTVVARVWRVCPRADARRPAQERTAAGAVITIVGLTMMVLLLLYEACVARERTWHTEDGRSLSKPTSPVQSINPTMMMNGGGGLALLRCEFLLSVMTTPR